MSKLLIVALLGCLGLMAPQNRIAVGDGDPLLAGRAWVQLVGADLKWERIVAPNREWALAGWAIGFRVNRSLHGTLIIDTLDRPAVAAFVGWTVPESALSSAPEDFRAVFIAEDGKRYVSRFAAGGGAGLLFHSPDEVVPNTLVRFELYRAEDAAWAKDE